MKQILAFVILIGCWTPAPELPAQEAHQNSVVFTHANVIDATGSAVKPDMTVVVTGDRVTAIGKTGKIAVPSGAQVVDATGKYLIPGLWDMHAHTISKEFLALDVASGVTGVRDMGNYAAAINGLRKQVKEGAVVGPRIIASGPIVDGPKPIWPFSIAVANEADGRKAVRSIKEQGLDFVKVYSLLTREGFFAIADEAKKQNIAFAGHVPESVTAAEASDAGQKSIEHLTGVLLACSSKEGELRKELEDPSQGFAVRIRVQARSLDSYSDAKASALFARFVKNHTWQCPTLTVLRSIAYMDDATFTNDPRLKYIPAFLKGFWNPATNSLFKSMTPEDYAAVKKLYAKALSIVGAMRRAGVQILAGTDTPNPYVFPGLSLHDELGLLVKAGLTPMEAIQAATRDAAIYLGLSDSVGTVETGKSADLVLLEANPLVDIANTQKIAAVVLRGKVISKSELQDMLAGVEEASKK